MKGSVVTKDNLTFKHGQLWEVRCPLCSVPIRKMVPSDEHQETKKINGKIVVFQRLVFACLSNYREVLVEAGGGPGDDFITSAHVMCMCAECAADLTMEQAQALHDKDMREFKAPMGKAVNRVAKVDTQIGMV